MVGQTRCGVGVLSAGGDGLGLRHCCCGCCKLVCCEGLICVFCGFCGSRCGLLCWEVLYSPSRHGIGGISTGASTKLDRTGRSELVRSWCERKDGWIYNSTD